jgi:hypothetical protein
MTKLHEDSIFDKEEFYKVGKVLMRYREHGLVTIIQSIKHLPESSENCQPSVFRDEDRLELVQQWFDTSLINLHYLLSYTVMETNKNPTIVNDISLFYLNFLFNETIVNNYDSFIAAQRFHHLLELNEKQGIKNVPRYSMKTISRLAELLYEKIKLLKDKERDLESKVFQATNRMNDIKREYKIVKNQQENYFAMEQLQLEALWESADKEWKFNFDHRNAIETKTTSKLDKIQDDLYKIRDEELRQALNAAELSEAHTNDLIDAVEEKIARLTEFIEESVNVQTELKMDLQNNVEDMKQQQKKFEKAVKAYKRRQRFKAIFGFFTAVVQILGAAAATIATAGAGTPALVATTATALKATAQLIDSSNKLSESIRKIDAITFNTASNTSLDLNFDLTTDLKETLQEEHFH